MPPRRYVDVAVFTVSALILEELSLSFPPAFLSPGARRRRRRSSLIQFLPGAHDATARRQKNPCYLLVLWGDHFCSRMKLLVSIFPDNGQVWHATAIIGPRNFFLPICFSWQRMVRAHRGESLPFVFKGQRIRPLAPGHARLRLQPGELHNSSLMKQPSIYIPT